MRKQQEGVRYGYMFPTILQYKEHNASLIDSIFMCKALGYLKMVHTFVICSLGLGNPMVT
jgi:hypothetical protein